MMLLFYTKLLVLLFSLLHVVAETKIRTIFSVTSVQSISQSQVTLNGSIASPLYVGLNFDTDTSGIVALKVKEMLLIGYNSLWVSVDLDTLELWHEGSTASKSTTGLKNFLSQVDDFLSDTDYDIIRNVVHININLPNRSDGRTWSRAELDQSMSSLDTMIRENIDEDFLYNHNNNMTLSVAYQSKSSLNLLSVYDFLFTEHKRVFFTLTSSITNAPVNVTQLANDTVLMPNFAHFVDVSYQAQEDFEGNNFFLDSTITDCPVNRSTSLPGVRVSMADSASILALRNCGYLPLLGLDTISSVDTNLKELQDILFNQLVSVSNFNIWSWSGSNQPVSSYRCAVLESNGWRSEDCSNEHHVLCASSQNATDFFVSEARANYSRSNSVCAELSGSGEDYNFTLPRSVIQNIAVHEKLQNLDNDPYPVWIDINSLDYKDCWVTGGPDSLCPFTSTTSTRNSPIKTQWNRNKVALLTIACVITLVVVLIILFLRLDHLPIRNNESKWKKLMLKYKNSQYSGVPS